MSTPSCLVLTLLCGIAAPASAGQRAEPDPPPVTFELVPKAYIQLDWRAYPQSPIAPGTGRLPFDTFEVRRLRAGVDGRWRGVRFEFTTDPQDLDGTLVKDAYGEIRPGNFEIRFGQFKVPGSREYQTSARSLDFLERSAPGRVLAPQRDLGVALHGKIRRQFDYELGLFAGDNNGSTRRSGLTGAGRLEWEPSNSLVFAIYGSEGRLTAVDSDPENGFEGRLSSGYRFFENVYVNGRRTRVGGDVEYDSSRPENKGLQIQSTAGGDPFSFELGASQVIEAWERGVPGMRVGGRRRLVVPPDLAFGDTRSGLIPPNATLVFDIELASVTVEEAL